MRQSLIYLLLFITGVVLSVLGLIPEALSESNISEWVLYLLLFLVGIQIGSGKNMFTALKRHGWQISLIPIATTVGTFAGVIIVSLLIPDRSVTDCLSVGAGFAYYSLSSIIITEFRGGAELGTVALLANIMREFSVLILAPNYGEIFREVGTYLGRWRHNNGHNTSCNYKVFRRGIYCYCSFSRYNNRFFSAFMGLLIYKSVTLQEHGPLYPNKLLATSLRNKQSIA